MLRMLVLRKIKAFLVNLYPCEWTWRIKMVQRIIFLFSIRKSSQMYIFISKNHEFWYIMMTKANWLRFKLAIDYKQFKLSTKTLIYYKASLKYTLRAIRECIYLNFSLNYLLYYVIAIKLKYSNFTWMIKMDVFEDA